MSYNQGAIVIADDPFGNSSTRPYLILSNKQHPFHGEEYIAAIVTTTAREQAIELTEERIDEGRLPKVSHVSPWAVLTLKDWMITQQPAKATNSTVEDVYRDLGIYLRTQQ